MLHYLDIKHIKYFETRDLCDILAEDLGFDNYVEFLDSVKHNGYKSYTEGELISISDLKHIINQLEQRGATHIALEPHIDHRSYIIEAFQVNLEKEKQLTIREIFNNTPEEELKQMTIDDFRNLNY